jgi:uncharacterized protein (TIGR02687 family)
MTKKIKLRAQCSQLKAVKMEEKQLVNALKKIFVDDNARIVFWNDPEKEFEAFVSRHLFLVLDNETVQIILLDKSSALETKIRLEIDEPDKKFLLYSTKEEPKYDNDWLLDIRLYSTPFRADRASIILDELNLSHLHLREYIYSKRKFFDNRERLNKLKPLVDSGDLEEDLDRKIISVVVRADQPEWFTILMTLFHAYTENRTLTDLDEEPETWHAIEKYDLAGAFWEMIEKTFGYKEESPTLKTLLIRLMVSELSHFLKDKMPASLTHLSFAGTGRSNAVVFLAQWRDSSSKAVSYDKLSEEVEAVIKLENHLHTFDTMMLKDVMTFPCIEKKIASDLKCFVMMHKDTPDNEYVNGIAARRQAGHWASLSVSGDDSEKRKQLYAVYTALMAASDFFVLLSKHRNLLRFETADDAYKAYTNELYQFDRLHRRFCVAADKVQQYGWDILKESRDIIASAYINSWLKPMAMVWDQFMDTAKPDALLKKWKISRIPNQYEFYRTFVQKRLAESDNRRVFVIISDAFRYEAAKELTDVLNGKYRYEAELKSQLGTLPSCTSLGMACLLPHETLTLKENADVQVDGKNTGSFDHRQAILETVDGICIRSKDLLKMKKDDGRNLVADKKVVYIYHDMIDTTGETRASESRAFHAVSDAVDHITSVITFIIDYLNGTYVLVTADHGFLFTETAPGDPDKSRQDFIPAGVIKTKKRYIVGRNLGETDSALTGSIAVTAGADTDMQFRIPRGVNLFHFSGGTLFVHGGATLQEIVVPVVIVKQVKGKLKKDTRTKKVAVSVLGSSHRITTHQHRFELIQTEPVSDRVKPITLKIAVYEADSPVTNIEKLTFDSVSNKMDDRRQWVSLVLEKRDYSKTTPYRLILRDADTGIEIQYVPVIIDRTFHDDF